MKVAWRGKFCTGEILNVEFATYANGRTAIQLIGEDGPFAVATVNIPEAILAPDEVLIKDYSENEGMLQTLVTAGIVQVTDRGHRSGWVNIPICKLLRRE